MRDFVTAWGVLILSRCGGKVDSASEKVLGEVVYFNADKGYGFLSVFGRDENLFIHVNDIAKSGLPKRPLYVGERVRCRVGVASRSNKECAVDIEMVRARAR